MSVIDLKEYFGNKHNKEIEDLFFVANYLDTITELTQELSFTFKLFSQIDSDRVKAALTRIASTPDGKTDMQAMRDIFKIHASNLENLAHWLNRHAPGPTDPKGREAIEERINQIDKEFTATHEALAVKRMKERINDLFENGKQESET